MMARYWILAVLSAFGIFCCLGTLLSIFLSSGRGGAMVCICRPGLGEELFLRRCRLLRELGLMKAPLIVVDEGLEETDRIWLEKYVDAELCSMEQLPEKLESERNRIE